MKGGPHSESECPVDGCVECARMIAVYSIYDVDDAMVERGGRALCDLDNEREQRADRFIPGRDPVALRYEDWRDEFNEQARAVIIAALTE